MEPSELDRHDAETATMETTDYLLHDAQQPSERSEPGSSDVHIPASPRKRPASPSFDQGSNPKRLRESGGDYGDEGEGSSMRDGRSIASRSIDGQALLADLEQDLQCGCCSELLYRPVIVSPCQHYFCGSCVTLWIKNGGTNCPACRSISTAVTPSRPLQLMIEILLRAAPYKARAEREQEQADEIYAGGRIIRIPTPREPSPEPQIPSNTDSNYVHPCPHCAPGNAFGWTCPQPIIDPTTAGADGAGLWRQDEGTPPGHSICGNCEVLLALAAPTTTRCDFCQVSFCGINVQTRCTAAPLLHQHPQGLTDLGDLLMSSEVYECFSGNSVEVELMIDYLREERYTPRAVYKDIMAHLRSQPAGFTPLIQLDLFMDIHGISGGVDPDPTAPRNLICRLCATEVLLWGLRDWWVRERRKMKMEGRILESLRDKPDCVEGELCSRQSELVHSKEFNHIIISVDPNNGLPYPDPETQNEIVEPNSNPNTVLVTGQPHPLAISSNTNTHQGQGQGLTLPSLAELGFPMPPLPISSSMSIPMMTMPGGMSMANMPSVLIGPDGMFSVASTMAMGMASIFGSGSANAEELQEEIEAEVGRLESELDAESQSQAAVEAQLLTIDPAEMGMPALAADMEMNGDLRTAEDEKLAYNMEKNEKLVDGRYEMSITHDALSSTMHLPTRAGESSSASLPGSVFALREMLNARMNDR